MNPNIEPRHARTEFEWHLRGFLIDIAAIVTAATPASIACVLTAFLFAQIPVLMTTTTAAVLNSPSQSACIPGWAAAAALFGGVLVGAGVGWQVFTKVSRVTEQFFGRFALLPPPFTGDN